MRIPADAVIPEEKLTRYLLIPRARDDKSKFLAQAGFTQENPKLLISLRLLASSAEAVEDGTNEYGTFYPVEGELQGANERNLAVVTIWIRWDLDGSFHFVTLKPQK
jgi:hypothetical protein